MSDQQSLSFGIEQLPMSTVSAVELEKAVPVPVTAPTAVIGGGATWPTRSGVRASAGSGKTYELTSHYIRALLMGAHPAGILATTFTRKAAGEILGRVLTRLAGAAASEAQLEELRQSVQLPGLTQDGVKTVLRQLCRSLHQVSISTLDSFFGRVLRCYRHELDLPGEIRTLDESSPEVADLKREAVRRLLEQRDAAELVALLDRLHRGMAKRSVAQSMLDSVSLAHGYFQLAPKECWEPGFALPRPRPQAEIEAVLAQLEAMANSPEYSKWSSTFLKDLRNARQGWEAFMKSGLGPIVAAGEVVFSKRPIPDEVAELYLQLVEQARAELGAKHAAYTLALYELMALYDAEYRAQCRERRVLLFADVPLLLSEIMQLWEGNEAESERAGRELAHRLDGQVTHLLLDEFQDTDPRQYAILRPLARAIHQGPQGQGLIFCVGDLKQSIYGWRGATPEIFERIGADLPQLVWSSKNESFRSSQIVLDAVNLLFGNLPTNAILTEKAPTVANGWGSTFGEHRAMRERPGYVELLETRAAGESESEAGEGSAEAQEAGVAPVDEHLACCAERIEELARQHPHASIGVLVRSNAVARSLIGELKRRGVAASAEGGNPIVDHPLVEQILAALQLADHPGDSAAACQVFNSPVWPLIAPRGGERAEGNVPNFGLVAHRVRRQLLEQGYAGTIAGWISALEGDADARGRTRLNQLVQLAEEFDGAPLDRVTDFIRLVMNRPMEEPSADPVKVMTIHKSKGLEFDVVVLPQLYGQLRPPSGLIARRDEEGRVERVTYTPNSTLQKLVPQWQALVTQVHEREIREALCLLYVAMTRPRHALHILVPQQKLNKDGTPAKRFSLAAIVRAGLEGAGVNRGQGAGGVVVEASDVGRLLYAHGNAAWDAGALAERAVGPQGDGADAVEGAGVAGTEPGRPVNAAALHGPRDAPASTMRPRGLPEVNPSRAGDENKVHLGRLLRSEDRTAMRRGIALHAMLRTVRWGQEPLPPDAELLARVRAETVLSEEEFLRWRGEVDGILERVQNAEHFRQPAGLEGQDFELWLERPFQMVVDGQLVTGRFDRVLVEKGEGRGVRARVLDWKTDSLTGSSAAQKAALYREQMRWYGRVLREMLGGVEVEAGLIFAASGEIVPVPLAA